VEKNAISASRLIAVALLAPALTACTLTLPVAGAMEVTHERFAGQATGHIDGAGELALNLASGARCAGAFVYVNGRQGSGTLQCTDGRSGTFSFVSTGKRGTGSGFLDGAPFTFTFG
jgi:hypothetical protein